MNTPQTRLGLTDMFQFPTGREYSLTWYNSGAKGEHGIITATDLLFNYFFYPTAFGIDGAFDTRTYKGCSGTRRRSVSGNHNSAYSRGAYTLRLVPTFRSNKYDAGKQVYLKDGDDLWNIEITGRLTEFRIWCANTAKVTNSKRPLIIYSATKVGSTAIPIVSQS